MTRPSRQWRVLGLCGALCAASVLAAAPAQAQSAENVQDASFVWGLNGYAQAGIFGPWTLKDFTGNATQLTGTVSGGSQTEYAVDPLPATSMPVSSPQKTPNAVKFTGGTGTVDPVTGAGTLSWTGSYTVNAYPAQFNAPNEIYRDPVLTVAADGSGSVTAEFSVGGGNDMSGNPIPPEELGRLTVITFDAGSLDGLTSTGYRVTPDYRGVTVDLAEGTPQVRTCSDAGGATGWWGSWPTEFVTKAPSAVRSHFYSTGCGGNQDYKAPLPFDVAYTTAATPPSGSDKDQDLKVVVPQAPTEPGEFVWTVDGSNGLVDLGTATQRGDHYLATGSINPIRVTDTRENAPAWSVSAQVSDFTAGTTSFDGKYLGWTPAVTENSGSAVPGAAVAPGFDSGAGLSSPATLGSAPLGHASGSARLGAELVLKTPLSVGAGSYSATLTLTALS
ncbi:MULTISPECIES: hypothetical protein [Actinosynnema]|uniref:hypothetical protein n=1 Tax=Actinosynnema TaxID=40566 RepID=UPI0020A46F8D|nr:hypothetical protein [Actinosynnema pretiosum]MCP2092067.1 hypothetical protein [Actinosynnema pretiosum]